MTRARAAGPVAGATRSRSKDQTTTSTESHSLTGAVLVGNDLRVPVPGGSDDDLVVQRAEDAAVAGDPAFRARVARARADLAAGRGIPSEELERYFSEHRPRRNRGTGTGERGQILVRLPPTLHKRLNDRARARGISLNTLVIELLADAGSAHEAAGDG